MHAATIRSDARLRSAGIGFNAAVVADRGRFNHLRHVTLQTSRFHHTSGICQCTVRRVQTPLAARAQHHNQDTQRKLRISSRKTPWPFLPPSYFPFQPIGIRFSQTNHGLPSSLSCGQRNESGPSESLRSCQPNRRLNHVLWQRKKA